MDCLVVADNDSYVLPAPKRKILRPALCRDNEPRAQNVSELRGQTQLPWVLGEAMGRATRNPCTPRLVLTVYDAMACWNEGLHQTPDLGSIVDCVSGIGSGRQQEGANEQGARPESTPGEWGDSATSGQERVSTSAHQSDEARARDAGATTEARSEPPRSVLRFHLRRLLRLHSARNPPLSPKHKKKRKNINGGAPTRSASAAVLYTVNPNTLSMCLHTTRMQRQIGASLPGLMPYPRGVALHSRCPMRHGQRAPISAVSLSSGSCGHRLEVLP